MTRSLLFIHAQPGRGHELLRIVEQLGVLAVASEQPGFLGVEVAAAVDDEDSVVIIGSWASPEHYERWLGGAIPGRLLKQIEGLVTTPTESRLYRIVESVS
jgi:heme-degrading monooxygenase HmoA